MNNEVEAFVGELSILRRLKKTIEDNRINLEKWTIYLDSEIRLGTLSEHDKKQKQELKNTIVEILK